MKALVALFFLAFAIQASGQIKTAGQAAVKVPFDRSQQVLVITTPDWDATAGSGRLFERKDARASWRGVGESFPVVVGRSGVAWAELLNGEIDMKKIKQESDGNAPAGLFPLMSMFGTAPRPDGLKLPYTRLGPYTECVDDSRSRFYNRIVDRMQVGSFDWKSSEKMLEVGDEYALGIFVAYNTYPVEKGRGSCIFLHIWKEADQPTSGCTAMGRRDLERIAGWLASANNPYLAQMPIEIYEKRRKSWKLPKLK